MRDLFYNNLLWFLLGFFVIIGIVETIVGRAKSYTLKRRLRNKRYNNCSNEKLFSVSLDAAIVEWCGYKLETLFLKGKYNFQEYLGGWLIYSEKDYRKYLYSFFQRERVLQYEFIIFLIKNKPKSLWEQLFLEKFGDDDKAIKYYLNLSSGRLAQKLKKIGIISKKQDIPDNIIGYDCSVLVSLTKRAYSKGFISDEEAWSVLQQAADLARKNFNSWNEYAKSYITGFLLNMSPDFEYEEEYLELFKQLLSNPRSPWKMIHWKNL